MQVNGDVQGHIFSRSPPGPDNPAFQKAVSEALGVDSKASAGVFSTALNPHALAETFDDSITVELPDPEESQAGDNTSPAAFVAPPESSLNDKLQELYGEGPYTPAQINDVLDALNQAATPGKAAPAATQTRTVTIMVEGRPVTVTVRGKGAQRWSTSDIATPGQSWQGKSLAMYPKANGGYGIAPIIRLTLDDETVPALWMGGGSPPPAVAAGSRYYNVYQATRENPLFGLRNGEYVIIPAAAGGSPGPEEQESPDFRYDSRSGTVAMTVNGKPVVARFWGEGPSHLSLDEIAMPDEPFRGKSFAIGPDGEHRYIIAPVVPWTVKGGEGSPVEAKPALWLGPGTAPPTNLVASEEFDKYYMVRSSRACPDELVIEPRRLGENLRPKNLSANFRPQQNPSAGVSSPLEFRFSSELLPPELQPIIQSDFSYSPLPGIVRMKLGDQWIEADFVGDLESPPTGARQIQIEGQPWQEGQSFILHKVSPQGRTFFREYIVVPRDPDSTETTAFRPATVHPFDAADPLRPDEIAVLKTIFTEKLVDLVHLRSGAFSSTEIVAAQLSAELSDDEMAVLQRRHATEFHQVYLTGNGTNGGGGIHYLIQGDETSVSIVIGPNVRTKQHTHPDYVGAETLSASPADYLNMQLLSELTGQQSETIVPANQPSFRYRNVYAGHFEIDASAQTVKLEINGTLVTVPILKYPHERMLENAAEIQMPNDRWYGQQYQLYRDRRGNYFISSRDYLNVVDPETAVSHLAPGDWIPRGTLVVRLRDGEAVKARLSDEILYAVELGREPPGPDNIRRPGLEDRGEPYRLYQDFFTGEWLIGFNNLNTPRSLEVS